MTLIYSNLLNSIEFALNDVANAVWPRATLVDWANEAMKQFPILRPRRDVYLVVGAVHNFEMPDDFREIVSVEYPISQTPPNYLTRMNHLEDGFYNAEYVYDIDYDYAGTGWMLWVSPLLSPGGTVHTSYLANHAYGMADDGAAVVSIPDEHTHIVVAYVVMKAYRERLSTYMQDPTAYSQIINQMVASVVRSEDNYTALIKAAQERLAVSRPTFHQDIDKFDRVY